MIDEITIRQLRELHLDPLVDILRVQDKNPISVNQSFDDRLTEAITYLYAEKNTNAVTALQKRARFKIQSADITSLIYDCPGRTLKHSTINELATCSYITHSMNVVLQGYTGSGKTYLACALGKAACANQYRTRYIRLPDLLIKFEEAATVSKRKALQEVEKFARYNLLILDEWLVNDLSTTDRELLLELMDRRYNCTSTIICTQYRKEDWLGRLGETVQSEAIADRLIHNAIFLELGQANMREYTARSLGLSADSNAVSSD